jgi:hypothetical protein
MLEQRCEELIAWSGGYPREIVRMLREFVKQPVVVDEKLFARLLNTAADAYRRTVTKETLSWLVQVYRHKDLQQTEDADHRRLIDRALTDNLVLRYKNAAEWFDLHPALIDMPSLKEALSTPENALTPAPSPHG